MLAAGLGVAGGCGPTAGPSDAPIQDAAPALEVLADTQTAHAADVGDGTELPDAVDATPCQSACPLERCGANDGCGASCPTCPSDLSCATCQLRLAVVELTRDGAGLPKLLTLGLDYAPAEGGVLPRLADIRLQVTGPATFLEVTAGAALLDAGKTLAVDASTGATVQTLADGVLRTVVLAGDNNTPIAGGRWLTWRFRLGGAFEPMDAPVLLQLRRDEPILAPPPAESAAGDPATLAPVAIWPIP